jgi:2-oxoglutarate ferredoxin oxidoreductase subunit gamma
MQLTEIRIAGFGGQGVILSAIVLGKATSIVQGAFATMTQNFGPEARGGACSAQLVLSDSPILYPYVTRPDILVVMSQEAYVRFVPELKDGGILIVEQDLVRVSDLSVSGNKGIQVYSVPATRNRRGAGQAYGAEFGNGGILHRSHKPAGRRRRGQSSCRFCPGKFP